MVGRKRLLSDATATLLTCSGVWSVACLISGGVRGQANDPCFLSLNASDAEITWAQKLGCGTL